MRKLRLRKSMKAAWITAAMTLAGSSLAFGAAQALPNGTIVNVGGVNYLTDPQGERYSGWFIDAGENWYYFNESDKAMKTGWHHDSEDGYWYYLNPADGKMVDGWQTIDGKEYFFQLVRNMGNYYFGNEEEKWRYALNGNIPYGAMYINTTTLDGSVVDENGAKISNKGSQNGENGWVQRNGNTYYYENGTMLLNTWKTIGGKNYYFGSNGVMLINTATPDGKYVGSDGTEVVHKMGVVTEAHRSAMESILEREMERTCFVISNDETNARQVDNEIGEDVFTKTHVREATWDYLYFSYFNENLIIPENPVNIENPHFNINSFYDREKVNELIENIYGVNPEFKSGEEIYFTGWNESHLEVSGDKITSKYHGMGNVDGVAGGFVKDLVFTFEDERLLVTGVFWLESKVDSIIDEVPFHAVFKINPNNRFPYQLAFVRMDEI